MLEPAGRAGKPARLAFVDEDGQLIRPMPADYGFRSGSGRLYQQVGGGGGGGMGVGLCGGVAETGPGRGEADRVAEEVWCCWNAPLLVFPTSKGRARTSGT